MNDEFAALENELRTLKPLPPSHELAERVNTLLSESASQNTPMTWWQRLGFNRPFAAIGWGVFSPALTAAVVIVITRFAHAEPVPSPLKTDELSKTERAATNNFAPSVLPASARATNVLYQALDEGVVLDGGQEPVRRLRYRSADLVEWRNPSTGANWEVSYPREDVVLVPVQAE